MPTEHELEREMFELSDAVYDPEKKTVGDWTRLTDDELDAAGIESDSLINEYSGLKSGLYKNSKGEIVLAYAGTEGWTDVWVDIKQSLGFETEQYDQGRTLAELAKNAFGDKLSFTGHSLGGALAAQATAKTGLPATVFNPAGLHDNTLKKMNINPEAFRKQADAGLVKNIVVKGEAVDTVQELGDIPTPLAITASTLLGLKGAAIVGLAKLVTNLPDAAGKRIELEHPAVPPPGRIARHKTKAIRETLDARPAAATTTVTSATNHATPLRDQQHDLQFSVELDGHPEDTFRVTEFDWQEELSKCYTGDLTLVSRNPAINLNDCLDRNLRLTIHHKYDNQLRYLNGVVESITRYGFAGEWAKYKLSIQPELHRLSLTSDARIFQQISVPDIVATILKEQNIPQHELRLQDNHLPREYCVMYRESHLTFINRLLAEEGIFYFWEHSEAGAKLVFADHSQFGTPLVKPDIEYNNTPSGAVKGQFIHGLIWREAVRSNELKQRDYSFKNPDYDQEHKQLRQREGGEPQSYPLYNAYGRYKDGDSGKRFTGYRLDSVRRDASNGNGASNAMHMSAGHHFQVTEHRASSMNRDYMLIKVTHEGKQPQAMEAYAGGGGTFYRNGFECHALSAYSWRPQQVKKTRIDGPQMAHVVGPKGEEIYCDEHGRVKVQFPWDLRGKKDEFSSCWIRVSQGWAGAGWGDMSIPRIGQEVIVNFLEGDLDQPIITGRTYHAVNRPPYPLPTNKTRMTIKSQTHKGKGFNELRFEDEKDKEEVFIHAQKDQNNIVLNDESTEIGNNRTENVGKNQLLSIGENLTVNVTQASQKKAKSIMIKAADVITLKVGGSSIELTPSGIVIKTLKADIKGAAMVVVKGGLTKIN